MNHCCKPSVKITDTGSMTTIEKLCFVLESNEILTEQVENVENQLEAKEDSVNISDSRKLSVLGDFTGTLVNSKTALQVVEEIDDNRSQVKYLSSQFADGQTGLVIDGGFFEETGIRKNYNGGTF